MNEQTLDELRAVIVCVLDKLNQLESLFEALPHRPEAQAGLAEIKAYRVTARGLLTRIRIAAEQGGEGAGLPVPGEHTNSANARPPARVASHKISKSGNAYRDANR